MTAIQFGAIYGIRLPKQKDTGIYDEMRQEAIDTLKAVRTRLETLAQEQNVPLTTDVGETDKKSSLAPYATNPEGGFQLIALPNCFSRDVLVFTDEDKALFEKYNAEESAFFKQQQKRQNRIETSLDAIITKTRTVGRKLPKKIGEALNALTLVALGPLVAPIQWMADKESARHNDELKQAWGGLIQKAIANKTFHPVEVVEQALTEGRFNVRTGAITPPGQ